MANPLDLLTFARDAYQRTKQPLKERGIPGAQDPTDQGLLSMFSLPVLADMVAPVGTYEDGSVGLAWPKILKGPADAWGRMVDQSFSPDLSENDLAQMSRDSFDASGLAMTGGLAAAGAGMVDNALGSAGGRIAKGAADLPMDLASRMARAKEMGFDTDVPLYHGTRADHFDEFIPSKSGVYGPGIYASDRPTVANSFATDQDGGNVLPLFARGKFASMDDLQFAEDLAKSQGFGGKKKQHRAAEILKERGFSGVRDEEYFVIFDPRNIRSVNAAFDPAKSDSANLLAANAKSGAAVPLALEAADQAPVQGIRAYHGSPHDFDRFSLDKIGTGEGAQAYGHGLYFADSEDVARSYRDSLSQDGLGTVARGWLRQNGGDIDKTIEFLRGRSSGDSASAVNARQAIVELEAAQASGANPGRMYEVNIKANPEDFLDWDKPFREQPQHIQQAIENALAQANKGSAKLSPQDEALLAELGPMTEAEMAYDPFANLKGSNVISTLEQRLSRPKAGEALKELGIPGIKYLDGMSRDGGAGTSNYVVFDDSLIDILRKYANAPTGASVPLGMEANQDDEDAALMEVLRKYGLLEQ